MATLNLEGEKVSQERTFRLVAGQLREAAAALRAGNPDAGARVLEAMAREFEDLARELGVEDSAGENPVTPNDPLP
jgi:hypothetical protein